VQYLATGFGEAATFGNFVPEFEVLTFEIFRGCEQLLGRGGFEGCRDVVGGFVAVIDTAGEVDDASEELFIAPRGDSERLQIAGACGLDMEQAGGGAG
jgi:hypothetical protein